MKFDSFLTSPRWEILQILAKTPSSPSELAEKLKTTVAYMSQQLKLLDAAELVVKTKTGVSEKGKPRSVYALSHELVYLVSLSDSFTEKKLIFSTDYHQVVLKIWMIQDSSLHMYFVKLFFLLYDNKEDLDKIYLDLSNSKFLIVSDSKKLKLSVQQFTKNFPKSIIYDFISKLNLGDKLFSSILIPLYDPLLSGEKLKGGLEKKHE